MPPLKPEELEALKQNIIDTGITVPIVVDENGDIIDGYHRYQIAQELGIECPHVTVEDLTEGQKIGMAISLNVHRRMLTQKQKRELLAKSIKADPQVSDREHGRRTGTDHKTAAAARTEMEGRGEIPTPKKRTDSKGRKQPAEKPKPTPTSAESEQPSTPATEPITEDEPTPTRPVATKFDPPPIADAGETTNGDFTIGDKIHVHGLPDHLKDAFVEKVTEVGTNGDDEIARRGGRADQGTDAARRRAADHPDDVMVRAEQLAADMDVLTGHLAALFAALDGDTADEVEALFDVPFRHLRNVMYGTPTTTEEDNE